MRNFKKILSLVLCMAMMLSVMVVGAGAAFKDQEKIVNDEAVDMCVALNIINGYTDGSYKPEGNVTRAEMCKMICIALNGGKEPATATKAVPTFSDIDGNWAEGYVEYCYAKGIVAGVGGGKFNPNGNVTASQAAKMLLIALGYNADVERYVGASWELNVNVQANQDGLYKDLETIDTAAALTRDNAAQMIWNTLNAYIIEKSSSIDREDGSVTDMYEKSTTTDLLKDKYKGVMTNDTYDTVIMTKYSWDSTEKEYDYTFITEDTSDSKDGKELKFSSATDYSDLFGMSVNIVYKDSKGQDVYGIYADDSSVLATGILDDIEYSDSTYIKFDGVKYKVDAKDGPTDLVAYAENVYTAKDVFNTNNNNKLNTADLGAYAACYAARLIDNDNDGKVDLVVYVPAYAAKVTSIGTKQITVSYRDASEATKALNLKTTLKFEDETIYDGVAKDDYVVVTAAANTADDTYVVAKMDSISGKVTGLRSGDVQVDGSWYTNNSATTFRQDGTYTYYSIASFVFYADQKGAASLTDVLYVDALGENSFGDVQAKVYFYDGTSATIDVDDVYGPDGDTAIAPAENTMYTYSKDGSAYDLTVIDANQTDENLLGYKQAAVTGISKATDNVAGKMNSTYAIADDAVVFIKYMDGKTNTVAGTEKVKVVSGAVAKNYNDNLTGTGKMLYDTVNGTKTVVVANIVINEDLPNAKGVNGNYGYVVGTPFSTKIDGDKVWGYPIWDGTKEVTVYDKDSSSSAKAAKGDVITFDDLGGGMIDDAKIAVNGSYNLTTAAVKGIDGKTFTVYGTEDDGTDGKVYIITDDTTILYVDSDEFEGAESGSLQTAAEDEYNNGISNIKFVIDEADGSSSTAFKLDLLVIEVNNEF